jgi:rod shape-determining protein MreC
MDIEAIKKKAIERNITTAEELPKLSDKEILAFIFLPGFSTAKKISDVSGSFSHVLLVTDINFSVAGRLQESRIEGIVSGTGFRKCQMKYVPYEEEVKKGDIIITSGLDSLFPPGLPIGYVSAVNKKNIGIFQDIEVLPFVDNRKTEVVMIIRNE